MFILIEVADRSVSVPSKFPTLELAQRCMRKTFLKTTGLTEKEFNDAYGFSIFDLNRFIEDEYEIGLSEMYAYINDGPNHQDFDWVIFDEEQIKEEME